MQKRSGATCALIAALAVAAPTLAQGKDKAGPKAMALPAPAMMAAPPPPTPVAATAAQYPPCSASVTDRCAQTARPTRPPRHHARG